MKLTDFVNTNVLSNWQLYKERFDRFIIIDDFFNTDTIDELVSKFPDPNDSKSLWFEYNNPLEKKFALDDIRKMPDIYAKVIHTLNSESFCKMIEELSGIKKLYSDPYLHGGGLHCSKKHGKLDLHVDYSIHPKLFLERRLNMIIYLTPEWKYEWNGQLEFWNKDLTVCENKILPKLNRAVIFLTNDESVHGFPHPLECPENTSRNSLALYYISDLREETNERYRAKFFKHPDDVSIDKNIDRFREERSKEFGIYNMK